MKWLERSKYVEQFGARLAAAALALPEDVTGKVMIHRFVEGLPSRLQSQTLLVSGTYDEVVAKSSVVAGASSSRVAEPVRQTFENRQHRYRGDAGGRNMGDGARDYGEHRGRRNFREKTCYYCREPGHIQRFCHKRREDHECGMSQGNGHGARGQANPASRS